MLLPRFLYDLSMPMLDYHHLMRQWYKKMRAEHPVVYDEEHSIWLIFSHKDGLRVRSDYATFSSASNILEEMNFSSIIDMDPPRHTQMRALVTQALSARTIANMTSLVESIVNELLDRVIPDGHMDMVADLAHPLPMQIIAHMLGLPREDWQKYRDWADTIVNWREGMMEVAAQFFMLFAETIEEHKRHPKPDILTLLIESEVDGQRLDLQDLMGFCQTLFIAGYISTANVLGSSMVCFAENPQALTQLQAQPELLPQAVEEILRYMDPLRGVPSDIKLVEGRLTTREVELSGQRIPEGARVKVDHFSVNFDEQVFTDADSFLITRVQNRHQVFGHGIHYCLGAPLARLEARIALDVMLKRLREIHVLQDNPLQQVNSKVMFGPKKVPLVFQSA